MKNLLYIALISLSVCLVGCEDLFDVQPETEISAEDLFSTEKGFTSALNGMYVKLTDQSLYGKNLSYRYLEEIAQRYDNYIGQIPTDEERQEMYNYDTYTYSKSNIEGIWQDLYNVIANANNYLSWMDKNGDVITNPNIYNRYKAEVLSIRAYCYFDALRLWGPIYNSADSTAQAIPYRTEYSPDNVPLMPANEVITKVIADLQTAEDLLESNSSSFNTRFSVYGVKGLLARVFMYRNDKTSAYKYALDVINHSNLTLMTSLADDHFFKQETLFGLSVFQLKDLVSSEFVNASKVDRGNLFISNNNYQGIFKYDPLLGQNDIRAKKNQGFYYMTTSNAWMLRKYLSEQVQYKDFVPLIRLSEMYYIATESAPDDEKHLYINKVRNARGIPVSANYINLADEEQLREALYHEYSMDYFGEGQYWYYLKRHKYTNFHRNPFSEEFSLENYVWPLPDDEVQYGQTN